jgi:hypothetical protein
MRAGITAQREAEVLTVSGEESLELGVTEGEALVEILLDAQ